MLKYLLSLSFVTLTLEIFAENKNLNENVSFQLENNTKLKDATKITEVYPAKKYRYNKYYDELVSDATLTKNRRVNKESNSNLEDLIESYKSLRDEFSIESSFETTTLSVVDLLNLITENSTIDSRTKRSISNDKKYYHKLSIDTNDKKNKQENKNKYSNNIKLIPIYSFVQKNKLKEKLSPTADIIVINETPIKQRIIEIDSQEANAQEVVKINPQNFVDSETDTQNLAILKQIYGVRKPKVFAIFKSNNNIKQYTQNWFEGLSEQQNFRMNEIEKTTTVTKIDKEISNSSGVTPDDELNYESSENDFKIELTKEFNKMTGYKNNSSVLLEEKSNSFELPKHQVTLELLPKVGNKSLRYKNNGTESAEELSEDYISSGDDFVLDLPPDLVGRQDPRLRNSDLSLEEESSIEDSELDLSSESIEKPELRLINDDFWWSLEEEKSSGDDYMIDSFLEFGGKSYLRDSNNLNGSLKESSKDSNSSEDNNKVDMPTELGRSKDLRSKFEKHCLVAIMKKCYKASKYAMKETCYRYECRRRQKKNFKRKAKSNCIDDFRSDSYLRKRRSVSDSDSEDDFDDDDDYSDDYGSGEISNFVSRCLPSMTRAMSMNENVKIDDKTYKMRNSGEDKISAIGLNKSTDIPILKSSRSCERDSRDICTKACNKAANSAFSSKKRIKKRMKRNCKRKCKIYMRGSMFGRSSSSSE